VGIEREGQVLLVRRRHEPYQGWWMLPAGFVEYGDSAEETGVREALEETGLAVRLTGLWGVYFGVDDPRNVAHLIVFGAVAVGGSPRPGDDASELAFFPPERLPERIAFEGQWAALRDWAGRAGRPLNPADSGGAARPPDPAGRP
jgi:ADP-ribose pyrophosphatase YjhB (NUDIX family)